MIAPATPPNLFLRGLRAAPGGAGPAGTAVEEVGVVILRQRVAPAGAPAYVDPLVTDVPYVAGDLARIRLESDLPTTKPALDVVVVAGVGDVGFLFGRAEVHRPALPVIDVNNLLFGWRSRTSGPRLADAGDNLDTFVGTGSNLPQLFRNSFFNGGRVAVAAKLTTGHSVRFEHQGTGTVRTVVVPAAPTLEVTRDGAPLDPPMNPVPTVDTVVLDFTANEFHLTWRAVFAWEQRLELTALEIS